MNYRYYAKRARKDNNIRIFMDRGGEPHVYRLCARNGATPQQILEAQLTQSLSLPCYAACLVYATHAEILEAHLTTHRLLSYLDLRRKGTPHPKALQLLTSLT